MLQTSGHVVLPEFLPESLREGAPPALPEGEGDGVDLPGIIAALLQRGETGVYDKVISAVERVLLSRVLGHTHGNQSQASELLGLNRTTLRQKLRALGLVVDKVVQDDG